MKYMLLIYQNPATWETFSEEERNRDHERGRHDHGGAHRVRRMDRRRGAGRPVEHQDGPGPRRRAGGDGRAVRRGQGAAGRLLRRRLREPRARDRDRRALARTPGTGAVEVRPLMEPRPGRRCEHGRRASRTCCASWRRRSSARSSGATGTSTRARTRCRRRCSPPPSSGPTQGVPENPRGWLITVASRRLTDQLRSESARRRREDDGRGAGADRRVRSGPATTAARTRTTR